MEEDNNNSSNNIKKIALISFAGCSPFFLGIFAVFIAVFIVLGIFENNNDSSISSNTGGTTVKESGFTISKTSLSKDEYKDKIEEYAENQNSNFKIFAENAEDIYEYAVANNVNPELVVIRAYVEGGGSTTGGTNNYWGIGCYNGKGKDACYDYDTFEEGYTDYINNISQYDSLVEMASKYAYIGKYWYNPGSSSLGGCYYAQFIYHDEIPDRVSKACTKVCTKDDTANCEKTTDEDQEAYANWQIEKMASVRKTIFGLESTEGPTTYGYGTIQQLSEYNLGAKGLTALNKTLTTNEISELNNYIDTEIEKAGYGTGAAVAAAGQSLAYWLEQNSYYLQYYWGGGHGGYGDHNTSYTGVNANWGSTSYGCDDSGTRCYFGFDCSGFVSWAIRTACNSNLGVIGASYPVTYNYGEIIDVTEAKPGDVMVWVGQHIMLVVKNNGDGSVIVAESRGMDGLVFTKQSASNSNFSKYKFVDMSSYYQKNCKASRTT